METLVKDLPGHLSFSQLSMWLKCQRQHWYRYGLGVKAPGTATRTLGGSIHEAIAYNNRCKADTGRDAPWSQVSDMFDDAFQRHADDTDWQESSPEETRDRGTLALKHYHGAVAPQIVPSSADHVERRVLARLGTSVPLLGYVDLVTREGTALPLDGLAVHYLVVRAKGADHLSFPVQPPALTELAWWLRALDTVRVAVKSAYERLEFLPAPPGAWWCSARWCGYWERCRRDWWRAGASVNVGRPGG